MLKNLFRIIIIIAVGVVFLRLSSFYVPEKELSTLSQMTLEEKIAQLLIIRVSSTEDEKYNKDLVEKIARIQPGGVCFFKGSPTKEASLTNRIQAASKIPMFIAIDGEWGPSMRLDSCVAFPRQMTLGALSSENDSLIYQMGIEVAKQCKAVGINLNFAPCIDVNNNSKNPVINSRSFGENCEKVSRKAALYMHGMQDGGICTSLKHFPGHGDTETDSHYELPIIKKSFRQLDSLELYPYKQLLSEDPDMVMVAHLNIPTLDSTPNSVSSLSYPIVTKLLKEDLGYKGIIITDGMEMKGVLKQNKFLGDVEIKALLAGADILLLPAETDSVIAAIKNAVLNNIIPEELINDRCLRVLKLKEKRGILNYEPIDLKKVQKSVNSIEAELVNRYIETKALTLLKNDDILPLTADAKTAFLCVGRPDLQTQYKKIVAQYNLPYFYVDKKISTKDQTALMTKLAPYTKVVVAFGGSNQMGGSNYGIEANTMKTLNQLAKSKSVVFIHLGNPYALNSFSALNDCKAVVVAYQFTPTTLESALYACFGNIPFEGKLPVSINFYNAGSRIAKASDTYETSELSKAITTNLDKMLADGVKNRIYPGCVVLALHHGNPIYHRAFGTTEYDNNDSVNVNTMYDVASITKIAATTLAVMKLYDNHEINLTDKIGKYLHYLSGTDKANLTLDELLTHTSGLPAFIPFYKSISGNSNYLQSTKNSKFSIKVADNLYLRNDYCDSIRKRVANCKLGEKKYVYSDLNFLLLKDMVETVTMQPIELFLSENFYKPMGLKRTCFRPLENGFSKSDVAPTENDKFFRKQLVRGYVHDQTSALMNGNAGNAGLFSTAQELGAIMLMLQNKGVYNGQRLLSQHTVELFTKPHLLHHCHVRGYGFYTPKSNGTSSIVPEQADNLTFGHQGFTGTVVWCDPKKDLVFVFLSNRVCPDTEPNKLSQSKIRLKSHELIYNGISK